MKVRNIEVEKLIGEAPKFRIYLGTTDDHKQVILKVAKTFEDGDILAKEAGKFNTIRVFNDEITAFEKKQDKNSHYDWLFANLQSSFLESSQDDRRINVFEIPDTNLDKLIPLAKLHAETEIDARTSAWILGRFFKLYSFFELIGVLCDNLIFQYPVFSPDDYFIGPKEHRLIYYNFSEDITDVIATDFVRAITKFILDWVVIKEDSLEQKYFNLLKDFSEKGRGSFENAHKELYKLLDELWGIKYYPFTYRDKGSLIWKTIKEG